jgi:nucleotidyltransferase substrate binding protein (TIGR01987 family)
MAAELPKALSQAAACKPHSLEAMARPYIRWLQRLESYRRALAALKRAVATAQARELSELEELGLIQAFEFTHELSWQLLKDVLVDQGITGISGSRDAVRESVRLELLPQGDELGWMAMIRSRNLTSHTYNPAIAREIALLIVEQYAPALERLLAALEPRAAARLADGLDSPAPGPGAASDPAPGAG